MEKISNETLLAIREKSDIVDIVSSYLPLIPRGKNYFGVCPFHDDSHPSMSVSKEKQIYKCFACGATGNVFKFVADYENIGFVESVKMLADKCSISLDISVPQKKQNLHESLYQIYELAGKFYQNNINTKEGSEAREYLHKRKLEDPVIKEFGIGLSLKNTKMLSKLLSTKSFSSKDLDKAGLLVKYDYEYKDLYYDRIMFPLWDLDGKIVGFSGRIYRAEDPSKYINTRETDIFKKGELLYNYHRARGDARKTGTVLVMEGFMDVIRAYTIGVTNVVATMGTAVTRGQASLIKRMAKNVILCFDGDEAGAKATLACADELGKIGVTPQIIRLESNMDPDDYIKTKGKEAFLDKVMHPMQIMEFKLGYYKKDKNMGSAEDTADYLNTMIGELSKVEDDILKEITLQKMSEETHLDIDFLRKKLEDKTKRTEKAEITIQKKEREPLKKRNKYQKAEQNLLYYMLLDKEVVKTYIQEKPFLPNPTYRALAMEITHFYSENRRVQVADIMTEVEGREELMKALGEIISLELKETYKKEEIEDYIKAIHQYNIGYEINRLKKEMIEETNPLIKAKIAEEMIQLRRVEENHYDKRNQIV